MKLQCHVYPVESVEMVKGRPAHVSLSHSLFLSLIIHGFLFSFISMQRSDSFKYMIFDGSILL